MLCKLIVKRLMLNGRKMLNLMQQEYFNLLGIARKIKNENMICTILFMLVGINMQYVS